MGSINKSHNESDGGVVLFSGELILIYCDAVTCEIGSKESVKGRIYLTTHRIIFVATPMKQTSTVKSFCAPFFALTNISLEQPVFGANYIKSSVKDEADHSQSFTFKLKFYKGGAIEFARAMDQAASAVNRMNPNPPAYTPTPENNQYYQAPPSVYAPGYNCGFQMPTQQFPDQPPIGFIYASAAPPPYPGMTPQSAPTTLPSSVPPYQQGPAYSQPGQGYPPGYGQQQPPPYASGGGYSAAGQPTGTTGYPGQAPPNPSGYPGQVQPPANQSGYPGQAPSANQSGYPGQAPPSNQPGYPGQVPPAANQPGYPSYSGYPAQAPPTSQPGYPGQAPPAANQFGYPGSSGPLTTSTTQPAYPNLGQVSDNASAPQDWPSAPSFNPNWQEEKKSQ